MRKCKILIIAFLILTMPLFLIFEILKPLLQPKRKVKINQEIRKNTKIRMINKKSMIKKITKITKIRLIRMIRMIRMINMIIMNLYIKTKILRYIEINRGKI
jgi:hypothetical protein